MKYPNKKNLSQEYIKELFEYNNGELFWKVKKASRTKVGDKAGCINGNGYIQTDIDGKSYKNHHLIYLFHHGYIPENEIDHINRVRSDNRIENLREVTRSCNMRNSGNQKNNTSGIKGVTKHSQGKWQSSISIDGKKYYIGLYDDLLEASCARLAAEQCLNWVKCDKSSSACNYVLSNIQYNGVYK